MIFHKKIEEMYKAQVFTRYDDTGIVHYFSHTDFEGLNADPYSFKSSHGHTLSGMFYSYDGYDKSRLIIFEHGMGGGHLSYMKEIEMLCRAGYLVFSYDHTGCMKSGGENTGGFSQSLCDLDDCLKALKSDDTVNTSDISVVGHSWGGYSTLNISALHPDITKIVVLSGFVSVEIMVKSMFKGILSGYRKHIMALERNSNPTYIDLDAISALSNTNTSALLIYSDNDPLINKAAHYDVLCSALSGKENISFLLAENKGHNPNYTSDAVEYLAKLSNALKDAVKLTSAEDREKFKSSFDWHRMTEQDDKIWAKIFDFLK